MVKPLVRLAPSDEEGDQTVPFRIQRQAHSSERGGVEAVAMADQSLRRMAPVEERALGIARRNEEIVRGGEFAQLALEDAGVVPVMVPRGQLDADQYGLFFRLLGGNNVFQDSSE